MDEVVDVTGTSEAPSILFATVEGIVVLLLLFGVPIAAGAWWGWRRDAKQHREYDRAKRQWTVDFQASLAAMPRPPTRTEYAALFEAAGLHAGFPRSVVEEDLQHAIRNDPRQMWERAHELERSDPEIAEMAALQRALEEHEEMERSRRVDAVIAESEMRRVSDETEPIEIFTGGMTLAEYLATGSSRPPDVNEGDAIIRTGTQTNDEDAPLGRRKLVIIDDAEVREGDLFRLPSTGDDPSGRGTWVVAKSQLVRTDRWDARATVLLQDGTVLSDHQFPAGTYLAVLGRNDARGNALPAHDPRLALLPDFVRDLLGEG